MTLNVLIIGDPVAELKPGKETTLAIAIEGQNRGYGIDYCTSDALCQKNTDVFAYVEHMTINVNDLENHISLTNGKIKNLIDYDLIILRSNPSGYKRINTSYMLDPLSDKVMITNDPRGIREMHGKFFISNFPDFIVPYAIVEHPKHFEDFVKQHKDVIVKPVNGFGGHGVRRLNQDIDNIEATFFEIYNGYNQDPFIIQQYVPEATKGDKRIIMFDGEPVCSLLRVPKNADSLANITQGATIEKCEMTLREQALCREIGPIFRDYGLFFTGIDMLGDYLTEINLISVGTLVPANNLYDIRLEETFWDKLEVNLKAFKEQAA